MTDIRETRGFPANPDHAPDGPAAGAPSSDLAMRLHRDLDRIWSTPPGIGRLSAVNHTIVGRRFIVAAFVFFTIGGLLAMLIRAQLATPHGAFVGPELYNQIFTMHGSVMMFLFAIPMFEGVAIYMLPKLLGARDLAFPRLTAYGFWCYVFGGSILVVAMLLGVAPDGGWFMYTPLSSNTYSPGINADVWLLGITFVEISAICAAVEITVTILKMRAPGMTIDRMPLFAWYILVTAGMMLAGFPPLILGSILLEVERAFDLPFFDPARGGDPLLWQHLFWLFGHPEVYIIFLPGAGMVSTILPVMARREIVGYTWIVVSVVAVGFLSFGLWVHHMFTTGIPHLALGFFSAASTLVAIPTGVQIFSWLATLIDGRPQWKLPMLYLFGFFVVFVAGGLTGVMVAVVPFDWQVHDTHFVVAHMHYVLVGGFVFPLLAAAYYWLPHVSGKVARYPLGHAAFWLIFIGFNLTFFIMHLTGLLGMPRRVFSYEPGWGWDLPNLVSSFGGFLMTIGFALFVVDVTLHVRFGRTAPRNPWGASTLEWATATPPAPYNFASLPTVSGRHPLRDAPELPSDLAGGRGYLGFAREGRQETLGIHMTAATPDQVIVLPGPTYLPLFTALATGIVFLGLLFKVYWLVPVGAVLMLAMFMLWTRSTGQRRDGGPLPIGRGASAPVHSEAAGAPSWWAMVFTLVADGVLFSSLAFGALFLWVSAPAWPPPQVLDSGWWVPALTVAGLAVAAVAGLRAVAVNGSSGASRSAGRDFWLLLAAAGHAFALAWLVVLALGTPDPTRHAYGAATVALLAYAGFHAALGCVFALFGLWRSRTGHVSAARSLDLRIGSLWHGYTAVTGAAGLLLVAVLAWLVTP
ncbi:cytochrome c oxidase subunit I [Skermanella rosea]|uniref:cytochrome c oxidase subunit I n=1 Tax=Skermanella rosea TaxID=1817965 RepID=UPI001E5F0CEF|nr:cytochrome c oxidase subunit I [Skermanella rosea]UEM01339.1 cytochrome c oxidase subunit I [Skermanella rosea]